MMGIIPPRPPRSSGADSAELDISLVSDPDSESVSENCGRAGEESGKDSDDIMAGSVSCCGGSDSLELMLIRGDGISQYHTLKSRPNCSW